MALSRNTVPFMAIMALAVGPQLVHSLDIEYCSSLNTGSTPTNSSIWQSNGLCHDFCVDQSFAFAVLQQFDCWCSNYIPVMSSQVGTGECNNICPGWKEDTCGGGDDLYGYIALGLTPSGTADASSTSTPTGQTSTTTVETSSTTTSVVHSTATSTSTTSSTLPGSNTRTTNTADPTTSVRTVTAGGTVTLETVTVTPTPGPGSGADKSSSSSGPSSGAIAGIVIGILAVVGILAGLAIFFYLRRRKRQREEELMSRPHSHLSGSIGVMSTPTTTMASVWDGENTSTGRRSSRLMPHDPRMDPFATNIYSRFENKSRESINTLQDNQDYSRKVLRTTNPDPPDE
ncbi:hypothetical protein F4803DRAFT_572587 [Xylaria telfairii]|nr:hypothetical protein F4803DRAFT_572587 [Xylaria telfairii]